MSGLNLLSLLLGFWTGNEHFSMSSLTNYLQFKGLPGLSPSPYLYLFYLRAFCGDCQTSPCFPKDITHYYPSVQFSFKHFYTYPYSNPKPQGKDILTIYSPTKLICFPHEISKTKRNGGYTTKLCILTVPITIISVLLCIHFVD